MSTYAIVNTVWLVGFGILVLVPKRACTCGRTRRFYFYAGQHARARWEYLWAIYFGFRFGWLLVHVDYWSVVEALIFTWCLRWLWFHEYDRWKRAARALGRVFVNEHGRLAVSTER